MAMVSPSILRFSVEWTRRDVHTSTVPVTGAENPTFG